MFIFIDLFEFVVFVIKRWGILVKLIIIGWFEILVFNIMVNGDLLDWKVL